jgi:membrane fusion protein, multidrug efflux system
MSTASEPMAPRPRPAPRLVLPPVPPPAPPARGRHWFRLSWLLGVALLTVSLVGASHVLHSRPADTPARDTKAPAERSFNGPPGVVCHGTVEIEGSANGYYNALAPAQAGEVTEVLVYEGQNVKAGDILLRVNDEPFQTAVAQAEIGVRLAELDVAKAKRGLEQHRHGVEAKRAEVEATKHAVAAAEAKLHRAQVLVERKLGNEDEIKEGEETLNAAKQGVEAKEADLRRLEASKPEIEVQQAEESVALARDRVKQARAVLDHCVLKAPTDGTVLRLNVSKGVLLTAQTRQPPVVFAPAGPRIVRAEVEQEFAPRVQPGMPAAIFDDTNANAPVAWTGTVKRLADAYLPRRGAGETLSLTAGGEGRVLECVIELAPSQAPPRLGQRVRVNIGTHGGA